MKVNAAMLGGLVCARKAGGWFAVLLALVGVCVGGPVVVQEAAEPKAAEQVPALPPEVEAKFVELLKKLLEVERKRWDAEAKQEMEAVIKETGLEPRWVKTLEAAAARSEDLAAEEVKDETSLEWRRQYAKTPSSVEELSVNLDGAMQQMGEMFLASMDQRLHYTRPLRQPAWLETLAHTLTPEQAAAWNKARPDTDAAMDQATADFLDTQAAWNRQRLTTSMQTISGNIAAGLDLPKDRADALTALSKQAVDAGIEAFRKGMRKRLLTQYDAETRRQTLKEKNSYYGVDDAERPENQPVWKEGLARLLSDEDRARLKEAREMHRARRVRALGLLLVKTMDEKLALTAEQRPRLEPVAERLVGAETQFFPESDQGGYQTYNLQTFYQTAAKVRPEDVRPTLDDLQWKHCEELGHLKDPRQSSDDEPPPAPAPAREDETAPAAEPEATEQAVSDYLQTHCAAQHRQLEAAMILQAEDAARVVRLEPPARERLQTAARGAAETMLTPWAASTEQNVRSEVEDATPENIRQKLAGMSRYSNERSDAEAPAVWKATVAAELTPAQRSAWEAERDARSRYGEAAVAEFLVAEFDRQVSLTPAQWERLAPVITRTVREYQPDLASYFSYSGGSTWYLSYYSAFIPFHAVPETEFKALLSPAQWERWAGCPGYQYSANYWTNLQQNHASRVKAKKP